MRAWLYLLAGAAVYAAAVIWAAVRLPADGVALHFAADGAADRLGSRGEAVTTFALLGVLILAVGAGVVALARWGPLRLINVPHKQYWMRADRRPRLRRMIADDVGAAMGVAFLYLCVLPLTTVTASASEPPGVPSVLLWGPLVLVLAASVAWLVRLHRTRYAPVDEQSPGRPTKPG